jgi:hypothetical protein
VALRVREACLSGVRLASDRQPAKIRIDEHRSGPPHIWLHTDNPDTAWIVVDIAPLHWVQLAYQLGHELGHVLCNSWEWQSTKTGPSQWLEEGLVEAFSIRGLGLLADSWEQAPPFPNNQSYAATIRQYRDNLVAAYRKLGDIDFPAWLRAGQPPLTPVPNAPEGPATSLALAAFDATPDSTADLGALNRWPERTALPLAEYLARWVESCTELGTPGALPARLREVFGLA